MNQPSFRWLLRSVLISAGVLHYAFFHFEQARHAPPPGELSFAFAAGLACLIPITGALLLLPLSDTLLTILAFIPFDTSLARWRLPGLSAVDYLSVAALIVWGVRLGPRGAVEEIFSKDTRRYWTLWLAFMVWGAVDAWCTNGSLRPVLRWGEFVFFLVLARTVLRQEGA